MSLFVREVCRIFGVVVSMFVHAADEFSEAPAACSSRSRARLAGSSPVLVSLSTMRREMNACYGLRRPTLSGFILVKPVQLYYKTPGARCVYVPYPRAPSPISRLVRFVRRLYIPDMRSQAK